MRPDTSSRVFGVAALLVVAFQLALVLGAPWGGLTWGGRFPGVLPPAMRALAGVSVLLLLGFLWVVRARAGLLGSRAQRRSRAAIWGVVAYSALGLLANAVTPSVWERRLWLPVVVMMLATSLRVALTPPVEAEGSRARAGPG